MSLCRVTPFLKGDYNKIVIIRGQFLTIFSRRFVQGYKYSTERSFLRGNNSKIRCKHVQIFKKSFLQNHWATSLDKIFLAIYKREHSHYYTNTFVQVFKLWPLNIYSQLCSHYISPFHIGMTLFWANCSCETIFTSYQFIFTI